MKTVIVGVDPGRRGQSPLPGGSPSGRRLSSLCDLTPDEFEDRFDRINLHSDYGSSESSDWRAAENLRPILRGRRVIALGRRVAKALKFPQETLGWSLQPECIAATVPHPSGLSRWWNDPENESAARLFMQKALRPCIYVEGFDNSGKTTLVGQMPPHLTRISSEDPPKSLQDCLDRIQARIAPGIVCDRSSGLISELVYAPVLRGRMLFDTEEDAWKIVRSIVHAVTFIYCRPSRSEGPLEFRDGEDPQHVRGVQERAAALVDRYEEVMVRLSKEGARVFRYDRFQQRPEEVIRCVV